MAETKEWMKQIFQIVMVVENLEETLENWKRMVEFDEASIALGETDATAKCIYKGEEIQCPVKYATFDLGGVEMKLVQPMQKEGGDPYSDSLKQSGPGIHHIGFCSDDYNGLLEAYAKKGKTPVYEEICGDEHYRLYDFSDATGLKIAPWESMTGPCAR